MTNHWTPESISDQGGRTALITGATSGIGLYTARTLAKAGARVILAGRDATKLDAAADSIRAGTPGAQLEMLRLDLSNLTSVREAAAHVAAHETVDLLVNNAGVMNIPERRTTADGFEMTFGTNHLGHFAFDALAWPAVERASAARIVTVSAIAATWKMGRLVDLMSEEKYGPMRAYAKSKRANIVYTVELARRLEGTGVEAVVIHPGAAMTGLQQHTSGLARLLSPVLERLAMGSPDGAAWPSLYAGTSADVVSGRFYGPAGRDQTSGTPKEVDLPKGADDRDEAAMLWDESERFTGVTFLDPRG